ncbi:ABC transporter substrate-binding protein [Cohnella fermenti]|uniref:Sugar ABC transporter substrate-binding protein n=1 Tax=Cohnella fermenti TaxID=2565925 RepID=A0A4S4BYF5_9BACL|nr:sugar ABC transporter substrate-binding protein [Cohnella fermenti]THF80295.1 sugar ABC transporter substrate-binding protein [Cohnella fermenti]
MTREEETWEEETWEEETWEAETREDDKVNKTNVKTGLAILLMSCMIGVLAACGGNSNSNNLKADTGGASGGSTASQTASEKAHDPVEIRVGVPEWAGEAENVEAVVSVFQEKYPYVTVNVEKMVGDPHAKVLAQAAANELPDVFWLPDTSVREFEDLGILAPLDEYFAPNGVDVNDVYPSMLDLGKVNNETYMVPRDYAHVVTLVNTTLLKNEGLPLPSNDWDWETFMDYAKKLTKKDASGTTTQWAVNSNIHWWAVWTPFALGHGGKLLDAENRKLTIASDPLVGEGLRDLWDLSKDGYALDPNGQYPEDMFLAGKVAFYFAVKSVASQINDVAAAKGFEWDVVPFPQLPAVHAVGGGTSGYSISSKSDHKEEAGAFVSMFLTADGQKAFNSAGNSVPVLKSMESDETWRNSPVEGKNVEAYTIAPEADILPILSSELPVALINEANAGYEDAMNKYLLGKLSLVDALQEWEDRINKEWK